MDSHGRYGDSPFIYPVYGLGGIPEGFSSMCQALLDLHFLESF